jgi:hypothetical protein
MDAIFLARALGFGTLIGFSLGALGAGGSILTVPILVYAMGVPVQGATGTSLAIVGLNAMTGALDHLRRGRSLLRTGIAFGVSGVVGAFAGVWLNHQLRGELIMLLFSLLMIAAAVSMLRRRSGGAPMASFEESCEAIGCARLVQVGIGVGFLTGFFGVWPRVSHRSGAGRAAWLADASGSRDLAGSDQPERTVGASRQPSIWHIQFDIDRPLRCRRRCRCSDWRDACQTAHCAGHSPWSSSAWPYTPSGAA